MRLPRRKRNHVRRSAVNFNAPRGQTFGAQLSERLHEVLDEVIGKRQEVKKERESNKNVGVRKAAE